MNDKKEEDQKKRKLEMKIIKKKKEEIPFQNLRLRKEKKISYNL